MNTPVVVPSRVGEPSDREWKNMVDRIKTDRCVPFLGAGASLGFEGNPGLPSGSQLAEKLAAECNYPGPDRYDLLRVAQFYQMTFDPHAMRTAIAKQLAVPGVQPGVVHRVIAKLPFRYVLTTNFDDLMERAFRDAGKQPQVAWYKLHGNKEELPYATVEAPIVYKLHGTLEQIPSLIATEDAVVDFLACLMTEDPPLPAGVKSLFENTSILFVGYGLKDWNVRVLLRAIRGKKPGIPDMAYFAVQRRPPHPGIAEEWEEAVMFYKRSDSVNCYDMDAVEFARKLEARFQAGG